MKLESIYAPPPASHPWSLEELLPGWDIRYFSYARRALARGLSVSGIGEGDTVLVPSFICRDLLAALAAVGAKAAYYDISESFEPTDSPETWPDAKAVIAVNYFGFSQNLSPFRAYSKARKAILIEDNAHGLFSRDKDGTLLGTRGDLGIFSLRKTLTLGNGAALISNSERKCDLGPQDSFEQATGKASLKNIFRSISKIIGPRATLCLLSIFRAARTIPAPNSDDERILPSPKHPDARLASPLLLSDEEIERVRRRTLYSQSSDLLMNAGFKAAFPSLPENTVPYAFAFRCPPARIAEANEILASIGLCTLPWPDLPDATAAVAPAHYKDVRLVHFLW